MTFIYPTLVNKILRHFAGVSLLTKVITEQTVSEEDKVQKLKKISREERKNKFKCHFISVER